MLHIESWYGEGEPLAEALAIRMAVFVEEQAVPLDEELDGKDSVTFHLLARWSGQAVGTARLFQGETAKVGRVAVLAGVRGKAIGAALMGAAETLAATHGATLVGLDAQTTAIAFYERLAYVADGPEFLDANIPHRHMTKRLFNLP
ncbi:MAG: GNAT family N-acetyltransferase [Candidatus Sericytochromatia bacterium]|nr:GNAT family N-acetyltransferase [Candidatus Sericytochromatia bacterium]